MSEIAADGLAADETHSNQTEDNESIPLKEKSGNPKGRKGGKKTTAMFYTLMTGKKTGDYKVIFAFIKDKFPEMIPEKSMSDYEKAMRKAMKKSTPEYFYKWMLLSLLPSSLYFEL